MKRNDHKEISSGNVKIYFKYKRTVSSYHEVIYLAKITFLLQSSLKIHLLFFISPLKYIIFLSFLYPTPPIQMLKKKKPEL